MNIIIVGDEELGFYMAKLLAKENHDITIIDPFDDFIKLIESNNDLLTITGDPTDIAVLQSANIAKADLLISVLRDEKINLVTCLIGKKLGAKRVVARVNNTDYLSKANKDIFPMLGIDAMVCPERIAAKEIVRLLKQNAATEIFSFSEDKLSVFLFKLDENALVLNKTLTQIAKENAHLKFRAVAILRNNKTLIPKGDDVFLVGDQVYVVSKPDGVDALLKLGGKTKIDIKHVMLVGGGRIGRKTAKRLENHYNVKLIELDKQKCIQLSNTLENTLVINGDARNVDLLEEEGIRGMDVFIAATGDSETNMLTCLLAKKYGVKKVLPVIENFDYTDLAHNFGIQTFINKKQITSSYIARFTMDAEVTSIIRLIGVDAEVLEFVANKDSLITAKKIKDLVLPSDAILGGIVRNNVGYIVTGDMQIQANDKVVVFSLPKAITKIEKYFK